MVVAVEVEMVVVEMMVDNEEEEEEDETTRCQAGGRGVMGPCDTNQEPISTVSARSLRRLRRGRTHWLKLPRQGTPPTSQQLNTGEWDTFSILNPAQCPLDDIDVCPFEVTEICDSTQATYPLPSHPLTCNLRWSV